MEDQPSPLEEIRRKLALSLGENAVFDGWSEAAVDSAADSHGVDPAQARLAVPKDQAGKIELYIRGVDRALEEWFTPERLDGLKIREKIRAIVWKRLEIMEPAREAVRRALVDPRHAAKRAHRTEGWMASGGRHVADRRRHEHRLQSLYEADDAWRGLRFDLCSSGWTTSRKAGPTRRASSTAASTT